MGDESEDAPSDSTDARHPASAPTLDGGPSGSVGGSDPSGDRSGRRSLDTSPSWHRSTKLAVGVGLAVAVVLGIYLARDVLSLVALSGLMAFLVAPLIRVFTTRLRMPRFVALILSYIVVLAAVILVGAVVAAGVMRSVTEIDPPEAVASLRSDAIGWLDGVRTLDVGDFSVDISEAVDPIRDALLENEAIDAAEQASDAAEDGATVVLGRGQVETMAGGVLSSVRTVGGFVVAALVSALVTFLVAVYISADSHKFHRGIRQHVPDGYEGDADRLSERLGQIWKGYLYGQLANSLVTGLMLWIVLWAIGLPGAFVFGVVMALLNMIPTFGPIIAAVPGVLAAAALGSTRLDWSHLAFALLVAGIYVVVVQVQANFLAPFITGRAVQMAPATILVGLVVGFQVGGLVGSLLVVPVLATCKEAARYAVAKLLDRDPFEGSDNTDAPRAAPS